MARSLFFHDYWNVKGEHVGSRVRNELVQIDGFVVANDFDRHGHVLELVIETEDFQQYIIANTRIGRRLYDHLFERMSVRGRITGEDSRGIPILQVEVVDNVLETP